MPEIAEVEIMSRQLDRWTRDKTLSAVEVNDAALENPNWSHVVSKTVQAVSRRGKYALVKFVGGYTLVIHYRMTGKTVIDPERVRPARAWLDFGGSAIVAFVDTRRFGTFDILATSSLEGWFAQKRLGPEPWPDSRTGDWWSKRLGGVRSPIKVAMMRQDRVAGLGNIAASEILFRAGIHPERRPSSLSEDQWARLAAAVPQFIAHTIAEEGGEEIHYVNQGGEGSFAVYGRAGAPCLQCSSAIARIVQSGRGTYLCPTCQSVG